MILIDEYRALVPQLEKLLAELDRLNLGSVAVHIDLGLRRLEELMVFEEWDEENLKQN